tara:strand:+ start:2298 stop:3836 length:1539 start_codon:yes stop_codon:yes gene_type:complete
MKKYLKTQQSKRALICNSLFKLFVILWIFGFFVFNHSVAFAGKLDNYGGFTDLKGKKTGFFHTQKIDGRWWLVTPEGHGFYGIGLSHPVTSFSQGVVTFSYNGDQEAWLRDGIKKMRDLGYNCVWSGPYSQERIRLGFVDRELAERVYREEKIPHAIHVPLIKHGVELKPGESHVDVFSDEYAQFVQKQVARYVTPNKDNPWIMGYYYGFGSFARAGKWINQTLMRESGSAGREHLILTLKKRYNSDIKKLNSVYKKNYRSWNDLQKKGGITYPSAYLQYSKNKVRAEDQRALIAEIVEQVHKLGKAEIRKVDSNHMILGCYVKSKTYSLDLWKRIAPYIDALAPQHFSESHKIKPVVKSTGLPAFLSDHENGNVYSEFLLSSGKAFGPVPDHLDRRVRYHLSARRLAGDPDFIGVSFCALLFDNSHWVQPYDRGQPGFYTIDNEPRTKTIETAKESNAYIYRNVRRAALDEKELKALDDDYHKTIFHYRAIAEKRRMFLEKNKSASERAIP